jgi:hypothetical protein
MDNYATHKHPRTFASVRELMTKIRTFINGWNDRCLPFTWTKTPDQILRKANFSLVH